MKRSCFTISSLLMLIVLSTNISGQNTSPVIVDVDKPKAEIQPTMWGIFFEDINEAADGGVYAELVMNRSFEFFKPTTGWRVKSQLKDSSALIIINRGASNQANPRYARISVDQNTLAYCLTNSG